LQHACANGFSICNSTCLEVMIAGASEDTGLAKERRSLAVPAEKVADECDEMLLENLQATFGSESGVCRYHHSQQLGFERIAQSNKPFNLPSKCMVTQFIKTKPFEARLTCRACPTFLAPLCPMQLPPRSSSVSILLTASARAIARPAPPPTNCI
jgi:hypothetical protein